MIFLENQFWKYECYIFDLDNTLYEERIYLFSAYLEISKYVAEKFQIEKTLIENFLTNEFLTVGRKNLFSKLIIHFDLPEGVLADILFILRNHKLENFINLYPRMQKLINQLILKKKTVCILTNGNCLQQRNKINQIDWGEIKNLKVFYASEIAPKPDPKSIFYILNRFHFNSEDTIFIGDSDVDEICALKANVNFINVNLLLLR